MARLTNRKVVVDARCRVQIPRWARAGIKPGDVLFADVRVPGVVRYAKAVDPFAEPVPPEEPGGDP